MPAISPTKLKLQTARLAEHYSQPGVFVREMHTLLKLYADHTHRPRQSGTPSALIESYNVPQPVMSQLRLAMKPITEHDPQGTLELCDALWTEPYLEHRLMACVLLGQIPAAHHKAIHQRVMTWAQSVTQQSLLRTMIDYGMVQLRRDSPNIMLNFIEEWLHSSDLSIQQLGLCALIPLVEENNFQNIPGVFRMIIPFLRNSPPPIRPDLTELLTKLATKAPNETAYTLRMTLGASENPDTPWLTRQVLPIFSNDIQESLRIAMKNAKRDKDLK